MGAELDLLQPISDREYVKRIVAVAGKNFTSLEWTEKATGLMLLFMFCSELEIGILRIQQVSGGKNVSNFYMGSLEDAVKVWRSLDSSWVTTSLKS